ncbi:MAG: response regulator [Deltaproteobacteria bacterium]|nr:response regulator [Deltaproteobacteria bacterium]
MAKPEDKTILVVDDEEDVREYLSTVLEDVGFNVVTAQDGNQALERLKEKTPDFISLDLVMPGKSGMRFLHDMRRNKDWACIPFVVVTAHANDELGKDDLQDILENGASSRPNVYLEKPVKPERYVRLICDRLGVELDQSGEALIVDDLRNQAASLLKGASREQLENVISVLKKS